MGGIRNKTHVGGVSIFLDYPVRYLGSRHRWPHLPGLRARHRRKAKSDELPLEERFYPIQVKQKDKVGRPDVDAFEAMMAREECAKGFFISFDYSSDALAEISRFFKQTQRVIVPLTVREILDEQIAHKLA
jgi:hypothetical protein